MVGLDGSPLDDAAEHSEIRNELLNTALGVDDTSDEESQASESGSDQLALREMVC